MKPFRTFVPSFLVCCKLGGNSGFLPSLSRDQLKYYKCVVTECIALTFMRSKLTRIWPTDSAMLSRKGRSSGFTKMSSLSELVEDSASIKFLIQNTNWSLALLFFFSICRLLKYPRMEQEKSGIYATARTFGATSQFTGCANRTIGHPLTPKSKVVSYFVYRLRLGLWHHKLRLISWNQKKDRRAR